jgi:hypothetical protein
MPGTSTSAPDMETSAPSRSRSNLIVFVLAISAIVVALMQTMSLPIVGKLPELLKAPSTFLMTEAQHLILVSCIVGVGVGLAYGALLTTTIGGHVFPSQDGFRTLIIIGCAAALTALALAALLPRQSAGAAAPISAHQATAPTHQH